jgi:uncharacterized protein with HEPN domain
MPKGDSLYVGHMLDMAQKALSLLEGKDRASYDQDEVLRLALAHLLQVIGEAANRVSLDLRAAHSQIPWKAIIGMRHRIVHDYMDVDVDIVWDTATRELRPLIIELEQILTSEKD